MTGNNVVLIPALNPTEALITYIQDLISSGFEHIVLVDDGSTQNCQHIFSELAEHKEVYVLQHAKNYGKGRALKNGFNFILNQWKNDSSVQGVITADSDGQHLVEDVIRLNDELNHAEYSTLFLGCRSFDYDFVPFKSKYGNKLTSSIFALLYGKKINDTQTGLRAISKDLIWNLLNLPGERFEYEINMLINAVHEHACIKEIPIKTIYINQNSETHFNPIKDSWKIYKVLFSQFFKYTLSSVFSSILDLTVFQLLIFLLSSLQTNKAIVFSTILARIASSFFNFFMNKTIVFQRKAHIKKQLIKYYILCILQMLLSAFVLVGIHSFFAGNELIEKIIVDGILFFISYQIQRILVFKGD